ncbi:hypothetical protein [Dinoroseobacter sp. S124A]|uniref:hypothetical protein n=1 Tax=Dinoroseobacter sp. S124A TaxID=3415128 RepID=UPI003C7DDAD2
MNQRHMTDLRHGEPVTVKIAPSEGGAVIVYPYGRSRGFDYCSDWSDAWAEVMDPENEWGEECFACFDRAPDCEIDLIGCLVGGVFYDNANLSELGLNVARLTDITRNEYHASAVAAE